MDEKLKKDYIATIGVDVSTIKIPIEKKLPKKNDIVTLTVWDLAGQDHFRNIRQTFYLGANLGILIFDVTRRETFDHLDKWIAEVEGLITNQIPFFLVSNKIDLPDRAISKEEMDEYAKKHDEIILTHQTSALTGSGIRDLFHGCAEIVYNGEKALQSSDKKESTKKAKKTAKSSSKKTTKKSSKKTTKKKATKKTTTKSPSKKTTKKETPKKPAKKSSKKTTTKSSSKKKKAGKKTTKK